MDSANVVGLKNHGRFRGVMAPAGELTNCPVPSKNSVAVAIQELTSFSIRLKVRLEWTLSIHAGARMGVLKAFVLSLPSDVGAANQFGR